MANLVLNSRGLPQFFSSKKKKKIWRQITKLLCIPPLGSWYCLLTLFSLPSELSQCLTQQGGETGWAVAEPNTHHIFFCLEISHLIPILSMWPVLADQENFKVSVQFTNYTKNVKQACKLILKPYKTRIRDRGLNYPLSSLSQGW